MQIAGEEKSVRITRSILSILSTVTVLCFPAPRGVAAQAGPTEHLIQDRQLGETTLRLWSRQF